MTLQVLVKFESGGCSLCDGPPYDGSVVIKGSVGRGGRNAIDDVKTIQAALNAVEPADGGPILKLTVDGIAGPLTIAAIEKYQKRQLGWSDGRVDTNEPTIHALNGVGGGGQSPAQKGPPTPPPVPPPKATPAQNKAFIEKIGGLLPRARHWVEMAQLKIDMASEFVRKGPVDPKDPFPALHDIGKPELALFDKYFHTGKEARAKKLQQLHGARRIYDSMQTVLTESLLQAPMFWLGRRLFPARSRRRHARRQKIRRLYFLWRLAPAAQGRQAAPFRRRQLRGTKGLAAGHDFLPGWKTVEQDRQLHARDDHPRTRAFRRARAQQRRPDRRSHLRHQAEFSHGQQLDGAAYRRDLRLFRRRSGAA
jgi:hypothetical protein